MNPASAPAQSKSQNLGRVLEELSGGSFRYYTMIVVNVVAILATVVGIVFIWVKAFRDRAALKLFDGGQFSWTIAIGLTLLLLVITGSAVGWIRFRSMRRKGKVRIFEHGISIDTPTFRTAAKWSDIEGIHELHPPRTDVLNSILTGPTWTIVAKGQPNFYIFGYDVSNESEFGQTLKGAAARHQFAWQSAEDS
jgi:hypothetical protein